MRPLKCVPMMKPRIKHKCENNDLQVRCKCKTITLDMPLLTDEEVGKVGETFPILILGVSWLKTTFRNKSSDLKSLKKKKKDFKSTQECLNMDIII